MTRGTLRVYLGAAPGVGKTFRMLGEGQRRAARGGDVVVGLVETHGRPQTAAAAEGLEVVPRKVVDYRGTAFEEMDVEAIVARHPELALVDELAHTNIPGSANEKRWQDVVALLNAGINVITTMNVQHLESLNDVVGQITGVPQRETVPDAVVRAADQIELVDMTAEALRRRLAHGNVYAPDKVDAALANYFRVGNLTALRELALLWLADSVEDGLRRYREQHGIGALWETRERVVVALTGGPEGEQIIRRAARIAARGGADLVAVHVARSDGLRGGNPADLAPQQALVESLGGRFHVVTGDDVPEAVLQLARAEDATQLVVGASRRPWWARVVGGLGTANAIVEGSGPIDVHIVTHEHVARGRLPGLHQALTRRRRMLGWLLGMLAIPAVTVLLAQLRGELTLTSVSLVYLVLVVAVALAGGLWPALAAALAASVVVNFWFTPPLYSFTIADRNNALALVVFVAVAAAVSAVVDVASRRAELAARSAADAEVLNALATTALRDDAPLEAVVEQARNVFGALGVALQVRDENQRWATLVCSGQVEVDADCTAEPTDDDGRLVVCRRPLSGSEVRLLRAFALQVGAVRRTLQLQEDAADARTAEVGARIRGALLAALGHDLRTPLGAIKASASTLRDADLSLPADDVRVLLAGIESEADRLGTVLQDLLDLGRLASGDVAPALTAVDLRTVLAEVLDALPDGGSVAVDLCDDLPMVLADTAMTRRLLRLLVAHAHVRASTGAVRVSASHLAGRVELRVADQGDPLTPGQREQLFEGFRRGGDVLSDEDPGLGLALASALAEAQGAALEAEDTPGGGLTTVLSLPRA